MVVTKLIGGEGGTRLVVSAGFEHLWEQRLFSSSESYRWGIIDIVVMGGTQIQETGHKRILPVDLNVFHSQREN